MKTEKGFTLTEILIVSVLTVVIFASVIGVFTMARSLYVSSIAGQEAQRDAELIMSKIIRGAEAGATRYGVRSAFEFTPPTSISRLDYENTDGNARSLYVSSGNIIYESPTESPTVKTLYAPPANTSVTLWFWEPVTSSGTPVYPDHEMISIYVAVTKTLSGRTVAGSVATSVNVRNLPK
ncbi:MAG: type II secretion system protein [Candidatus Omnitrophica bacterium]|nr:type II secretion system protein [Candidatus Omnitrophota bacterium]